jgi:hypothetical protein
MEILKIGQNTMMKPEIELFVDVSLLIHVIIVM